MMAPVRGAGPAAGEFPPIIQILRNLDAGGSRIYPQPRETRLKTAQMEDPWPKKLPKDL